jgi:DNA-damage-inducible protein J
LAPSGAFFLGDALYFLQGNQAREREIVMATQLVQAHVDESIKEEAAAVLASMGLTVSDALSLLLARVARDKALPFEKQVWIPGGDWTPNETTIAAMQETELETVTLDQAAGLAT